MKHPNEIFFVDSLLKNMINLINFINGKKSYILAGLGVIYALTGFFTGHLDGQGAIDIIWTSLGLATIKHAISKV